MTQEKEKSESDPIHPLMALRGIAKDVFAQLGGGEYFIRSERNKFYSDQED